MKKFDVVLVIILTFLSNTCFADSKLSALSNNGSIAKSDLTYDVASATSYNVNWDQVFKLMAGSTNTWSAVQNHTANVGIGSANPGQALDVNGTVRATNFIGAGTGLTGTAASLTSGTVTTNANLTGVITSSGNATSIASQTGTGTTFVMQAGNPDFTGNVGIGSASPIGYLDERPANVVNVACSASLSTAITNATAGDILQLGDCTYDESGLGSALAISKSLTIQGRGIFNTILSFGSDNIGAFNITSDNVTIKDLQITGTDMDATSASVVFFDASSAGTSFTNSNLDNVWVNVGQSTACSQIITFRDAGGTAKNVRVDATCSVSSGQVIGLIFKLDTPLTKKIDLKVIHPVVNVQDTNASFNGQVRALMHWHNGASIPTFDTTMEIYDPMAVCKLTAGGNTVECLQTQGPNSAGSGSVGVDYTYVYKGVFDGSTQDYAGCSTTNCKDYRIDDFSQTSLFGTTFGTGLGQNQNSGVVIPQGLINTNAIQGQSSPAAAPTFVSPANMISLTGPAGGANANTGTVTGTTGSGVSLTAGAGGAVTAATATGNGGLGGGWSFTAGAGAVANSSSASTNNAGAGGAVAFTTGAGGNASAGTANNGGNGGNFTVNTGAKGTGATANGLNGSFIVQVNGTEKFRVDGAGNVGVGSSNPGAALDIGGNSGGAFKVDGNGVVTATSNGNIFNASALLYNVAGGDALFANNSATSNSNVLIKSSSSGGLIKFNTNAGVMAVMDGNGNVGIGTTITNARLDLTHASGHDAVHISSTAGGNGDYLSVIDGGNVGVGSVNPGQKLDVNGTVKTTNLRVSGISGSTQCIHADSSGNFTGTGSDCGSGGGSSQWTTANTTDVYLDTGGGFGNVGIGTSITTGAALTVMNGNVGIGTWNPTGSFEVGTGTTPQIFVNKSTGNVGIGNSTTFGTFDVLGASGLIIANTGIATFENNETVQGLFTGNGEVDANNSIRMGNSLPIVWGGGADIQLGETSSSGSGDFYIETNSLKRMTIANLGNVGIGSTNPGQILDVNGTVRATQMVTNGSGNNIFTANVGIGSTAPGQALDVQGTVRVVGDFIDTDIATATAGTLVCVKSNGGLGQCATLVGVICSSCT